MGPKLSREEAIKKAMEVLRRGGDGGGGRGRGRGRGIGRGISMRRGKGDADEEFQLDLGDNADGERFVKRMGEERMKIVEEAFEEMSWRVLPSPMEDAYLDALHTNNLVFLFIALFILHIRVKNLYFRAEDMILHENF